MHIFQCINGRGRLPAWPDRPFQSLYNKTRQQYGQPVTLPEGVSQAIIACWPTPDNVMRIREVEVIETI